VPLVGGPADLSLPTHWRASTLVNGSPGRADPDAFRILSIEPLAKGFRIRHDGPDGRVRVLLSRNLRDWTSETGLSEGGAATVGWLPDPEAMFMRLAW
jgi:hypothetical protein